MFIFQFIEPAARPTERQGGKGNQHCVTAARLHYLAVSGERAAAWAMPPTGQTREEDFHCPVIPTGTEAHSRNWSQLHTSKHEATSSSLSKWSPQGDGLAALVFSLPCGWAMD